MPPTSSPRFLQHIILILLFSLPSSWHCGLCYFVTYFLKSPSSLFFFFFSTNSALLAQTKPKIAASPVAFAIIGNEMLRYHTQRTKCLGPAVSFSQEMLAAFKMPLPPGCNMWRYLGFEELLSFTHLLLPTHMRPCPTSFTLLKLPSSLFQVPC